MSRLQGLLDPEARAYFEAIEAAVRPGRHRPNHGTATLLPGSVVAVAEGLPSCSVLLDELA